MKWAVKNDIQFIGQRIAIEQLFSTIGNKNKDVKTIKLAL
ncbi:hypothetical protein SAMN04488009_0151 [Maribacter sedimenticola]|uniref:Transposase DDE domain-containing protein n=1 Tax=Maribacter sedimenticola TaxID=228956 RepID=A0ABY1SMV7_9FLAO|nr:hypothetical protein SAMN04488009_0151 [Maribacter sedimenticola]